MDLKTEVRVGEKQAVEEEIEHLFVDTLNNKMNELEKEICKTLKMSDIEESFLQLYNPLHVYSRLKELFPDSHYNEYLIRNWVTIYEQQFYKKIINEYENGKVEKNS